MRQLLHAFGAAMCAAVAAQAAFLWDATGRAAFTRYHDPAREAAASESGGSLADLFEETGVHDDHGALEQVPNRFTFGLLPSGADRHAISVATVAGPAALVGLWCAAMAILPARRAPGASAAQP